MLTKRNTFQKYYAQSELRSYIETNLDTSAIAVSPGIFFVFKDGLEQTFLSERQHIRREWSQLTQRERVTAPVSVNAQTLLSGTKNFSTTSGEPASISDGYRQIPSFSFPIGWRAVAASHAKAFQCIVEQNGTDVF